VPLAASTGPVNQCVREDAVYNYGEMVDVNLINACTDPVLVFGCAQGTGKNLGRWVCSDSERRGQVLVQAGDQRQGRSYAPSSNNDLRVYTYTDAFSVTRAPNTQYWWVACAERRGLPFGPASGRGRSTVKIAASTRRRAAPSRSRAPTNLATPLDAE
jgi:hypothetical protein